MKAWLLGLAVVLSAAGCGGNNSTPSCQDAANAVAACAQKLGGSAGLTADQCDAAICTNKQSAINCVVGLQCNDATSYNSAFTNCLTSAGCQ